MGSSKKRKEKARDFAKAKLKLGKGKQVASNATNTSFTSRTIALGQQSIGKENKDAPTTKRNLTFEDLTSQLKHYSNTTRKDALAGFRELLTAYPDLLYSTAGSLVPLLARTVGDESASVRKLLLSFLEWYLPALPPILLQPYHSILIFFTTSALAHIYPEVRFDAIKVLNLLLDVCSPSLKLDWTSEQGSSTAFASSSTSSEQNHSQRVLECYLSLLHVRSGIATNGLRTDMTPTAKALILSSLAKFLRLSLSPPGSGTTAEIEEMAVPSVPTWFFNGAFSTQRDYDAFVARVNRYECMDDVGEAWDQQSGGFSLNGSLISHPAFLEEEGNLASLLNIHSMTEELLGTSSTSQAGTSESSGLPSNPAALLSTLMPILVSGFLDSAPNAFSPSAAGSDTGIELPLETVLAVLSITRDLWRAAISNVNVSPPPDLIKGLEKLLTHMAPYFPFGSTETGVGQRSAETMAKLQETARKYAEIVALLYLTQVEVQNRKESDAGKSKKQKQASQTAISPKLRNQMKNVKEYVANLLVPSHTKSILPTGILLTPRSFVELLPTVWSLLLSEAVLEAADRNSNDEAESIDLFALLLRHFAGLPATSGVKKASLEFLVLVLAMQSSPAYTGSFTLVRSPRTGGEMKSLQETFLSSLPRYMWELGPNSPHTTSLAIQALRHAIITKSPLVAPATDLKNKIMAYMGPYFFVSHPTKGAIRGPWSRLASVSSQREGLELVYWLVQDEQKSEEARRLVEAVDQAVTLAKDAELGHIWKSLYVP